MRVRLVHHALLDGRYHVYTSPDLKGLHVTSETMAQAEREAITVLDLIAERRGWDKPVIAFVDAETLAAA